MKQIETLQLGQVVYFVSNNEILKGHIIGINIKGTLLSDFEVDEEEVDIEYDITTGFTRYHLSNHKVYTTMLDVINSLLEPHALKVQNLY